MKKLKQTILRFLFLSIFISAGTQSSFGMPPKSNKRARNAEKTSNKRSRIDENTNLQQLIAETSLITENNSEIEEALFRKLIDDAQELVNDNERRSDNSYQEICNNYEYSEKNLYIYLKTLAEKIAEKIEFDNFCNRPEIILNKRYELDFEIINDSQGNKSINLEQYLPENFSGILKNQLNNQTYDAAKWQNINLKQEWQNLQNKWLQIENNSNTATSDDLIYHLGARIMFVAIACVNKNQNINWYNFDWSQLPQDSLFTYALKVLKSNENEFAKIRYTLFNGSSDSYIFLHNNKLTNTKLAVLFPLILIKNNNTILKSLTLGDNQLTSLPKEIGNLTNLEVLELQRNQLTSLPTEIGNLEKLKTLSLNNNQLTFLPESIGKLTNLESLDISRNQLTSLPKAFGSLEKLEQLFINKEHITFLPAELQIAHIYPPTKSNL